MGVFLAWIQNGFIGKVFLMDGIREFLRFKGHGTAIDMFTPFALSVFMEEVAAVKLQTHLIAKDIHLTATLRFIERSNMHHTATNSGINNPAMIVAMAKIQLLMDCIDIIPDGVHLGKVERGFLHRKETSIGNQIRIHRKNP